MSADLPVLGLNPATLAPMQAGAASKSHAWLAGLYATYGDELAGVAERMKVARQRMLALGCSADFGDREAETLYLMVRHFRPQTVVEISPCHGYSTGYILLALAANGGGICHSYEIVPEHRGTPIEKVIRGNLPDGADGRQIEVHVGDATRATIPAADFAFIDSAHTPEFAAWYLSAVVPRVKCAVQVHDIVVHEPGAGLLPKGLFTGTHEQYFLLQSLVESDQPVLSVADFLNGPEAKSLPSFAKRYESAPPTVERSLLMRPHAPSARAIRLGDAVRISREAANEFGAGDRGGALAKIHAMLGDAGMPRFGRLLASLELPRAGYKWPLARGAYLPLEMDPATMTVSEFMAAFELAMLTGARKDLEGLFGFARKSRLPRGLVEHVWKKGAKAVLWNRDSLFTKGRSGSGTRG